MNREIKEKGKFLKRTAAVFMLLCVLLTSLGITSFAVSTVKLTGVTYPTEHIQGSPFVAKGIISSDYNILKVVIGVYNKDGSNEFEYTGLPGEKTYDISNVDYLLSFSKLDIGSYTYKIVASDQQNADVVLLNKSFTVVAESTKSTLTVSNANYPTSLKVGEGFSVKGTISSNYNITKVVFSAYRSDGVKGFEYTVQPNAKSYNIANADYGLTFSKLAEGSYTYKIVASDTKQANVTLLSKSFTVGTTATESTLKLTDANYPTSLKVGEGFSVKGTISSNYNITKVVFSAYRSDGVKGFEYTVQPNAKSYNIANADYGLTFSKLAEGSYTYKIVASDTKQANVTLLSKSFTVGTTATESTLKLTDANYPTTLTVGQSFSVKGTVSSSYNISKIVIGAYRSDGTKGFEYTAQPGTKSYNLTNVDYLLTFSKLVEDSYTYKITASDAKQSNVVLLEKNFTVKSANSSSSELTKVNWDVVDLSYWNIINSWANVAKNVDALVLRCGFSYVSTKKMEEDGKFEAYYNEAKNNNIPVGCYYYSAATTVAEAQAEANFVLNILKKYGCKLEMPVYYDLETTAQTQITPAQCTEVAKVFCQKLTSEGYYVGIYCNKYFARDELYASQLSDYQFWIAEYASSCTYSGAYGMWQYSERGKLTGISEYCDKNYCYYDYPSYIKSNSLNGFTATLNPQFKLITGTKLTVDESKKIIYLKNEKELTQESFLKKYVQSQDVSVQFGSLADGKIATGTTVSAKGGTKSFGPYTICLMGDVNSDGKINSADALAILMHTVGSQALKGNSLTAADINSDKAVNSTDALRVLEFSVSGK